MKIQSGHPTLTFFTLPSESEKNTRNIEFELCLTLFSTLSKQQITRERKEIRERDDVIFLRNQK